MIQCEVMKANSMQCPNAAAVRVGAQAIPMCWLHINMFANEHIKDKLKIEDSNVSLIDPANEEDQKQLAKIVQFTNDTITNVT
jgi:hypothetical protein